MWGYSEEISLENHKKKISYNTQLYLTTVATLKHSSTDIIRFLKFGFEFPPCKVIIIYKK